MFSRIPFEKVNWPTSVFLIGTLVLSLTAVPIYIWQFGIDWFQIALFFVMFWACGFSITLGHGDAIRGYLPVHHRSLSRTGSRNFTGCSFGACIPTRALRAMQRSPRSGTKCRKLTAMETSNASKCFSR